MQIPNTAQHYAKFAAVYGELTYGLSDQPVTIGEHTFRLMSWDLSRISFGVAGEFQTIDVWDENGEHVVLDLEGAKLLLRLAYDVMTARMPNYARLRRSVTTASVEELDSIDTTAGWPSRHPRLVEGPDAEDS